MKRGPKVKSFQRTKAFDRAFRKLPDHVKDEFKQLAAEMASGEYLPSRDLKTRKGSRKNQRKEWQARLSKSHRVTFCIDSGVATLLLIGEHKLFE